jgi:HSP20 family protein
MDWKKIAPWNWFKEEAEPASLVGFGRDPLAPFRAELERVFGDAFVRSLPGGRPAPAVPGGTPALLRPNVDISEGKKAYTVRLELPGVERDDVSLEVEGGTLAIHAEKRQEREDEDEGYHCIERSYGVVERVLSLPDDADGDGIEARFRNGVLKVRIPRRPDRVAGGRRIEIQAD